jgi:hypothetical protein
MMTTFSIELTPAEHARLIATATAQGVAPETLLHRVVVESLHEPTPGDSGSSPVRIPANTAQEASVPASHEAQLVNEGGVLVLAHVGVDIDDWDSLMEREREARIDAICHS